MARVEQTRTYPGLDQRAAWEYLMDLHHLPEWYASLSEVIDPDARWSEPGDRFRFFYGLLGRRMEVECVLDEVQAPLMLRYTAKTRWLPDVHFRWQHTVLADGFATTVLMETDEPTSVFGKAVDRMLVPRLLERDLSRSLDNLADIFTVGPPD